MIFVGTVAASTLGTMLGIGVLYLISELVDYIRDKRRHGRLKK